MTTDKKYLLAVSGGVDSMVMLTLLHRQGHTIGIAHFNHLLRKEADVEAVFVAKLAEQLNVPFHGSSMDILEMSGGKSVEDFARNQRRLFFERIRQEYGYDYICLAHHADDQAETVLNNFIRGTSVHGLGGMLAVDERNKIVRPLLKHTKEQIYNIARQANMTWFEDYTNAETEHDRCWLRNEVIPTLETRRPVRKILAGHAEHFQQVSDYLSLEANRFLNGEIQFHIDGYLSLHIVMRGEVLAHLWTKFHGTKAGFSQTVIYEVNRWLEGKPEGGSSVLFGKTKLTIRKNIVQQKD